MPGVATAAIVGFLNVYNELPIANVILTKTENRTISVALLAFQGDYQTSLSLIFASIVIVIIPILIFYLLCQEKVEHGLASGGDQGLNAVFMQAARGRTRPSAWGVPAG